jgi:glycosyltransferase involved in cell wall biosynthesis
MIIYIPQNIDPFNTHLKNLVDAYASKGIKVFVGYKLFLNDSFVPDIVHFHHAEGLLAYLNYNKNLFFERLESFRKKGVLILCTLHNFLPHGKIRKIKHLDFYGKYFNYVNLFIHHGESSIGILEKEFPYLSDKHHIVCHHGDYLKDMECFNETQAEARQFFKLPLNKKIILIFGQLQFKNTSFAKEVFDSLRKKHENYLLLMAGVFPVFKFNRLNLLYYKLNNRYLNRFRDGKILIHRRFSQYETYLLFISSDVVFLPHKSGLTTGIIPMAATLGKSFVYPDIGVFEEQANYCYAEKYMSGNKQAAISALDKILISDAQSFDNSKWLEDNNWEKHVQQILSNIKQYLI